MREILFRGKRIDNGEWVEGCFRSEKVGDYITAASIMEHLGHGAWNVYRVDPSTVGQYTGLCDKNGKKIFEGDLFRAEDDIVGVVIFEYGCFKIIWYGYSGTYTESGYDECGGEWKVVDGDTFDLYHLEVMEVIGNIHDNSELLEV